MQLPNGLWKATATLGRNESTGKAIRKAFYGKTRTIAVGKMKDAQADARRGKWAEPSRLTFGAWVLEWLETYCRPKVRATTYEWYRSFAVHHVIPGVGEVQLSRLQVSTIQRFYADRLEAGVSAQSVRAMHALIFSALRQATRNGLIRENPAALVEKPMASKKDIEILDEAQLSGFLDAAQGSKWFPAFLLEWSTGLRRGELLGLKWSDVDFAAGRVSVSRSLVRTEGGLILAETKTKAGRRSIPVPGRVMDALKAHRAAQAEARLSAGNAWNALDLVFCGENGCPLDPCAFVHLFQRVLRRAGLPRVAFHALRHSHATLLLSKGVHPAVVQERLGHADIGTTINTYSHVMPTMQQAVADLLETVSKTVTRA